MSSMPLFHSNAVVAGWAPAVVSGAAMVPAKFSATNFLDDVRRHGATYMNYVGKPLAYILATPERADDADNPLRVAFGNEATTRDIDEFGAPLRCPRWRDGFGSTENAVIVIREDQALRRARSAEASTGSRSTHSDSHRVCGGTFRRQRRACPTPTRPWASWSTPRDRVSSPGYYNDPAANAERLRHGMYWSGDLAYRDADGWIYLAGRTTDWMRVDGENMAAAPIERILLRHSVSIVSPCTPYRTTNVGDQVMAAVVLIRAKPSLIADTFDSVPRRAARSVPQGAGHDTCESQPTSRALPPTRSSSAN